MKEVWKPVLGWEGLYSVSNLGNVRREARETSFVAGSRWGSAHVRTVGRKRRPLKVNIDSGGYAQVVLQDASSTPPRRQTVVVHRLVLSAFRRAPEPGDHGMHRNDIRDDNRLANLKWGTKAENARDMAVKGRVSHGVRKERQLPLSVVVAIAARPGEKLAALAKEFRTSKSNVSKIRAKAKLAVPLEGSLRRRLSDSERAAIASRPQDKLKDLAAEFRTSVSNICSIRSAAKNQ